MLVDIFKTSIFQKKIDNNIYKKYFLNILQSLQSNKKNKRNISNVGGFQSISYDKIDNEEILYNVFLNPAKEFAASLNPIKEIKLGLSSFWINCNNNNDYNLLHNHHGTNISGVYYIKVPKFSGRLVFQNGDFSKFNDDNLDYFNDPNFYCRYFCPVEEGDLYLFSSETFHYVEPNRSEQKRISVAFNINIIK
jgi:uncharacterized protein (TIGR02466 family)